MIDSKYEILEARVAALEKEISKAPGQPPTANIDDRVQRIVNIIVGQNIVGRNGIINMANMFRGVQKAMTEFYNGPNAALQETIRKLEQKVVDLGCKLAIRDADYSMLWDRLQRARDLLDEDPGEVEEQRNIGASMMKERD